MFSNFLFRAPRCPCSNKLVDSVSNSGETYRKVRFGADSLNTIRNNLKNPLIYSTAAKIHKLPKFIMQNKSVLTNTLFFFNAVCDISRDKCILSTIFLDLDEIWQQLLMTRAGSEKGIDLAKVLIGGKLHHKNQKF